MPTYDNGQTMNVGLIGDPTNLAAQMTNIVLVVKLTADSFRVVAK